MNADVQIDVQIASDAKSVPQSSEISGWIIATLSDVEPELSCEVSVRVVDEDEGRRLNLKYRDKNYATNVLSFAAGDDVEYLPPDMPRALGDIVLCGPVVEKEAKEQRKAVTDHWGHMLIHGTLHLLGHDHEDERDAAAMESIETRILARNGVSNPYKC